MNAPLLTYRMTCEQFLEWVDAREALLPFDEPKWELFDGIPEMQEHEKWVHDRLKLEITLAFREAIAKSGLSFEVAIDGLGVRIGPAESYQPEVVVFPKGLIKDDDRYAPEPIIVVEVLSPSSRNKDLRIKAEGYAKVASIKHYLVVDPDARQLLPYARVADRLVPADAALAAGTLALDPPGLVLDVAALLV